MRVTWPPETPATKWPEVPGDHRGLFQGAQHHCGEGGGEGREGVVAGGEGAARGGCGWGRVGRPLGPRRLVPPQLVPKLSRNYLQEGYMEKTGPKVGLTQRPGRLGLTRSHPHHPGLGGTG